MKTLFIFIVLTLKLSANPDIIGVWQSTKDQLSCLCGHKTQLLIEAGEKPGQFKITYYMVGHSRRTSIGAISYKDGLITSQEMKFVAKVRINKSKDRLALKDTFNKYPWIYFTKLNKEKFDAGIASMTFTERKKSTVPPFSLFIKKNQKE